MVNDEEESEKDNRDDGDEIAMDGEEEGAGDS